MQRKPIVLSEDQDLHEAIKTGDQITVNSIPISARTGNGINARSDGLFCSPDGGLIQSNDISSPTVTIVPQFNTVTGAPFCEWETIVLQTSPLFTNADTSQQFIIDVRNADTSLPNILWQYKLRIIMESSSLGTLPQYAQLKFLTNSGIIYLPTGVRAAADDVVEAFPTIRDTIKIIDVSFGRRNYNYVYYSMVSGESSMV